MADIHNLVNFLRGTYKAYNRLKMEGKLDDDVLYFISNPGDTKGTLYLGDMLIGGGETAYLSQMTDVDVTNLADKNILVYNEDRNDWVATDFSYVVAEYQPKVFSTAVELDETIEEALARVTEEALVSRGDIALITKDNTNYPYIFLDSWVDMGLNEPTVVSLRKDVGWIKEEINKLNTTVGSLEDSFVTQKTFNTKVGKIDTQIKEIKD